jgi:hypothetical protein|eukprot:scaffold2604_cov198-Alexandrium_tamarense.AAC.22
MDMPVVSISEEAGFVLLFVGLGLRSTRGVFYEASWECGTVFVALGKNVILNSWGLEVGGQNPNCSSLSQHKTMGSA